MDTTHTDPTWAELLGGNNWSGLLDPLDLSLRKLILRCGDFCQATYDAFNNDQNSKYCGASRYGKNHFLQRVMFDHPSDYFVHSFLYATARVNLPQALILRCQSREAWDRESNWIGYIAVTTDEASQASGRREVYVVWRGTTRNYEWINVLGADLKSVKPLLPPHERKGESKDDSSSSDSDDDERGLKVMEGWLAMYTSDDPNSPFTKLSARSQLLTKMKELVNQYKNENLGIIFTGHSLGASLSVISAFDIVENVASGEIPVSAIIFGSPQVGNRAFSRKLKEHPNLNVLHVRNKIDLIPHYPGRLLGYVETGTELVIDTRKSRSLKDSKNPSDWHNLQAMLHVVAGWNGEDGEFEMRVKRSVALVNKSSSFLKEELLIPGSWWVEKNRGMAVDDEGEWVLDPPADEDLPVPDF